MGDLADDFAVCSDWYFLAQLGWKLAQDLFLKPPNHNLVLKYVVEFSCVGSP
jgi:hypothetical protein